MSKKKTLLMSAAATTVGVAMFAGVASAQTPNNGIEQQSLVEKIAQTFNLDKNEVQKVFDEAKSEREAKHQQKIEAKLTKAVEAGKITAEQKAAILDKLQGFRSYMESIKDKPREERKELMKAKHEELKKWAEEQGLDKYFPLVHKGMHKHGGMPMPDGRKAEQ